MTQNEKEIMDMAGAYLVSGNFSRTATVRVKFSAYGYSVKIGSKAFSNHLPNIWDCVADVEMLGLFGYNIEQANTDIKSLS